MNTDRELLDAAAKIAGFDLEWDGPPEMWAPMYYRGKTYHQWNPLTDDGDAFRLAVALRMCVESWGSGASAVVTVNNRALVAEPHYGDEPGRATRRAIVRAAAAMVSFAVVVHRRPHLWWPIPFKIKPSNLGSSLKQFTVCLHRESFTFQGKYSNVPYNLPINRTCYAGRLSATLGLICLLRTILVSISMISSQRQNRLNIRNNHG